MRDLDVFKKRVEALLNISLNDLPVFERKEGLWANDNKRKVTVIYDNNEIEKAELDNPRLLGVYKINCANEFTVFPDAIREYGKRYSDHRSLIVVNGKIVADLRNTMGAAMTAEVTGLTESDAVNYIETVCKIKLILFKCMYQNFGTWTTKFYAEDNIWLIEQLINQLTSMVIEKDKDLTECFIWLNEEYKIKEEIYLSDPLAFLKNIPQNDKQEWTTLKNLGNFINCFPVSEKIQNEKWDDFLSRNREDVQEALINKAKKEIPGWQIIKDYLTDENKQKHRGAIAGEHFGS